MCECCPGVMSRLQVELRMHALQLLQALHDSYKFFDVNCMGEKAKHQLAGNLRFKWPPEQLVSAYDQAVWSFGTSD